MKKIIIGSALVLALGFSSVVPALAAAPQWNATGSYVVNMEYLGNQYPHDMSLVQDSSGNLTGSGGSPSGANVYTWVVTSGSVSENAIDFLADYTATVDAVIPQTTIHIVGTIGSDGKITGTWSDNFQGSVRGGALSTVSGAALPLGSLAAEDFGVMDISGVKGYTAGFGLTDATFEDVQSVVMKLYSGPTLLQTNTATVKVGDEILGSQISSPFDVFGTFDYVADGYWVNVRGTEYGQNLIPTRVVAEVTLENGKMLTAENTNLTGNPAEIFPDVPPAPTAPQSKDDCKNGGWKTFTNPSFKNQGQCVSMMAKQQ